MHKRGFIIRKYMGVSPGQKKVAVITRCREVAVLTRWP